MRWAVAFLMMGAAFGQDALKLTLKQAEELAAKNSPRVAAARFTADAYGQIPKELKSVYQPAAFGSVTAVGADNGARLAAGGLNNPALYSRFASGVGVSQFITDFGRTADLVGSAESRAQSQLDNTDATRATALLAVDGAYFGVLRAQAVLKVAQQTVSARQLVADQIAALARNALKSSLDVSFANVNLAEAKLLLATAQNNLKASTAALANAIAEPNRRSFELSDEPMPAAPPDDDKTLIASALKDRPELAALRHELAATERFAKAEGELWRPTVSAVAAVGVAPAAVEQVSNHYGAVGMNLNIPILNGGFYKARRSEAELRARGAAASLKDFENRVMRDVQVAYLDAQTGYDRLSLT